MFAGPPAYDPASVDLASFDVLNFEIIMEWQFKSSNTGNATDNAATISDENNITVTEADYTAVNDLRLQLSPDGPIGKQWNFGRTRCGEGATEGQETAKDAAAVKMLVAKVRGTLTRTQCAAAPCTLPAVRLLSSDVETLCLCVLPRHPLFALVGVWRRLSCLTLGAREQGPLGLADGLARQLLLRLRLRRRQPALALHAQLLPVRRPPPPTPPPPPPPDQIRVAPPPHALLTAAKSIHLGSVSASRRAAGGVRQLH